MLAQNSTVTLRSGRVRIQLNERRCFPCVMVEKWTAVKCAKKIEPDRNIVFSSFAIPSSNRWAKLWWCAAGKRGERDVTRAYVQLPWDSERFWLVENATQKLPPAWAFEPLFKQKPCHKQSGISQYIRTSVTSRNHCSQGKWRPFFKNPGQSRIPLSCVSYERTSGTFS